MKNFTFGRINICKQLILRRIIFFRYFKILHKELYLSDLQELLFSDNLESEHVFWYHFNEYYKRMTKRLAVQVVWCGHRNIQIVVLARYGASHNK